MAKRPEYPNITPILQVIGTIWALGIITYLLIQNREVPPLLWLVAASAALGPMFGPVLDYLSGGRLHGRDNSDVKKDDSP